MKFHVFTLQKKVQMDKKLKTINCKALFVTFYYNALDIKISQRVFGKTATAWVITAGIEVSVGWMKTFLQYIKSLSRVPKRKNKKSDINQLMRELK